MNDDWLDSAISDAIEADYQKELAAKGRRSDMYRNQLRETLETLVSNPLPRRLQQIIDSLAERGYYIHRDLHHPTSNSKNPLAVGLSGPRWVINPDNGVQWCSTVMKITVWPEAHKVGSKDKLVFCIEVTPQGDPQNTYLVYRCSVGTQHLEVNGNPDDIDTLKLWIKENIVTHQLIP